MEDMSYLGKPGILEVLDVGIGARQGARSSKRVLQKIRIKKKQDFGNGKKKKDQKR